MHFSYESSAVESASVSNRHTCNDQFREVLRIVDEYLANLRTKFVNGEPVLCDSAASCHENRLTFEVSFYRQ